MYILNKKTKNELATAIFRNDNLRKKYNDLLNYYELLSVVGIEQFRALYDFYYTNYYPCTWRPFSLRLRSTGDTVVVFSYSKCR